MRTHFLQSAELPRTATKTEPILEMKMNKNDSALGLEWIEWLVNLVFFYYFRSIVAHRGRRRCVCAFLIEFFVSFDLYVFSEDTVSRHIYSQRLMHTQFHAHSFQFGPRALPLSLATSSIRSFWLLAANSFLHTFFICSYNSNWNDDIVYEKWLYILTCSNTTNAVAAATTAVATAASRCYFVLYFSINKFKWQRNEFVVGAWARRRWIWLTRSIDPIHTTYKLQTHVCCVLYGV